MWGQFADVVSAEPIHFLWPDDSCARERPIFGCAYYTYKLVLSFSIYLFVSGSVAWDNQTSEQGTGLTAAFLWARLFESEISENWSAEAWEPAWNSFQRCKLFSVTSPTQSAWTDVRAWNQQKRLHDASYSTSRHFINVSFTLQYSRPRRIWNQALTNIHTLAMAWSTALFLTKCYFNDHFPGAALHPLWLRERWPHCWNSTVSLVGNPALDAVCGNHRNSPQKIELLQGILELVRSLPNLLNLPLRRAYASRRSLSWI